MRVKYIYNPESALERNTLEHIKSELSRYVESYEVTDMQTAQQLFNIRATPAIIFIRDDLQGSQLLNQTDGDLRVIGEIYKAMQEEEMNLYQADTHRIDYLINQEVSRRIREMQSTGGGTT